MGNKSSHRKICATLNELAISLSYECSCLCANIIFAVMGCHPWTIKSLKHLCTLMYPKNSPRSGVTNLWSTCYLPGQFIPPSPHGLLSMMMWDSAAYQTSSLFSATSLTPVVLKEEMTFTATRTSCPARGPPWFEGTRQRVSRVEGTRQTVSRFQVLKAPGRGLLDMSPLFSFLVLPTTSPSCWCCFHHQHPTWVIVEEHKRAKSVLSKPFKYDCEAAVNSELC